MSNRPSDAELANHDRELGTAQLWVEILQMSIEDIAWGIANKHIDPFTFGQLDVGELRNNVMEKRLAAIEGILFLKGSGGQKLLDYLSSATNREVSMEWVMRAIQMKTKFMAVNQGGKVVFGKLLGNKGRADMLRAKIIAIIKRCPSEISSIRAEINNEFSTNLSRHAIGGYLAEMKSKKMVYFVRQYNKTLWKYEGKTYN